MTFDALTHYARVLPDLPGERQPCVPKMDALIIDTTTNTHTHKRDSSCRIHTLPYELVYVNKSSQALLDTHTHTGAHESHTNHTHAHTHGIHFGLGLPDSPVQCGSYLTLPPRQDGSALGSVEMSALVTSGRFRSSAGRSSFIGPTPASFEPPTRSARTVV